MFKANWGACTFWLDEANIRDRRQKAGKATLTSASQCLKLDPDLDSAPPRRKPAPAVDQGGAASAPEMMTTTAITTPSRPIPYPRVERQGLPPPPHATKYCAPHTPSPRDQSRTRQGTVFKSTDYSDSMFIAPMVEV
ncbi:uncharacterized protein LOC128450974 isoform X1 [Scomber scombrus]|uniref:Uncharacterized protein LOC128450974 isoform X1 n=1 Tax=Scomber scombrus TaxID=13677 RepID=A0AAV1P726_SCOSC